MLSYPFHKERTIIMKLRKILASVAAAAVAVSAMAVSAFAYDLNKDLKTLSALAAEAGLTA